MYIYMSWIFLPTRYRETTKRRKRACRFKPALAQAGCHPDAYIVLQIECRDDRIVPRKQLSGRGLSPRV